MATCCAFVYTGTDKDILNIVVESTITVWYKEKDQKTKKTKDIMYEGVVVSMDGENGELGVRFDGDGPVYPVNVSSVDDELESPPPPQQAGAGGQKRKRT